MKNWSFTRWTTYDVCPTKFKYAYIDKVPQPKVPAMERGVAIHKMAEDYIRGADALPEELSKFADVFDALAAEQAAGNCRVEEAWAFKSDWSKTHWGDYADCWLRVKADCVVYEDKDDITIIDWKTGKYWPFLAERYMQQLELYALSAFMWLEDVNVVYPKLYYLDIGKVYPDGKRYTRDDVPYLDRKWRELVQPMMDDEEYKPTPGRHVCRFCPYSRAKGGPCEF